MLKELQGNILKGHGREHTAHVFLLFKDASARAWVRTMADEVTSADEQFAATAAFKASNGATTSPPFVGLYISRSGYAALGVPVASTPGDARFATGLKSRVAALNDPLPAKWDTMYRGEVHAMLLVADDKRTIVNKKKKELLATAPASVVVLGEERGDAMRNENGDGIEHFGYVDGRSQPLLMKEDIEDEERTKDGIHVWDPTFPLGQVLVKDPASAAAASFGSYFVYRKLEQNVKGFKAREQKLATALGLKGEDRERAGAMMVGRFEDGTPVVLQNAEGMHHPVPNNFNYEDDALAQKCPFHAHIRKSNPRGESTALGATLAQERAHIMARRGITYGKRKARKRKELIVELLDEPTKDVGLLFMAFMGDVGNQFEFTQATWVNNPGFVKPNTGVDPVIGQGGAGGQHMFPNWGNDPAKPEKSFDFRGFVTLKGGEYFFAPSISGLASL